MTIQKFTIYGERCSGTNYLEALINLNFNAEVTWEFGWKHFFGLKDLPNSDDTLFIGIVRNFEDWANSLYRERHHLPPELIETVDSYLSKPFYSTSSNNEVFDLNMFTQNAYTNIFELRQVKNQYLVELMPQKVKYFCLITHDDLLNNFSETMHKLFKYNLEIKNIETFPLNISSYVKKANEIPFEKMVEKLKENPKELIDKFVFYERVLFPNINW